MLAIRDLSVAYGNTVALRGVEMEVPEGACVSVLGNNGAGKTTLLRSISGLLRPRRGSVVLRGQDLGGVDPSGIVRRGVVHVPEGRQVFADLTVAENLAMGAFQRRDRAAIAADRERVFAMFPRLAERLRQKAGSLSCGEQQMLAIGRGLMARPAVMLIDEPSLGLSPRMVREIFSALRELNRSEGLTLVLVEQNAQIALQCSDYGYVLGSGRVVVEGSARDLLDDPDALRASYLGVANQ
jgi:branched-chain amino acid transport system ATP-binding protein